MGPYVITVRLDKYISINFFIYHTYKSDVKEIWYFKSLYVLPWSSKNNLSHPSLKVILIFEWSYGMSLYWNPFPSPLYVCMFVFFFKKNA